MKKSGGGRECAASSPELNTRGTQRSLSFQHQHKPLGLDFPALPLNNPCSRLSKEDMKTGAKRGWKRCTTVFTLTFLGLFVWQLYSKPDGQSGEFQAQLQNQTTQVQAQLETCTEALKKDRDKAKKESDDLRAQLAMATQSLSNYSQRWDSCRKELHNLQDNITSQSQEISKEGAEKRKLQGEIKRLQQQMSEWENQKKQEQPTSSGSIVFDLGITLLPFLALLLL